MRYGVVIALLALVPVAQAGVDMAWVDIGHAGNRHDTEALPAGSVAYDYQMGTYEVTAGQYVEFLNAVAADDAHGLYNIGMNLEFDLMGCNIEQHGNPGSYTYSVPQDWANRPVNYVSFGDAMRFANWLHNGQPTGAQDASTTEAGSYTLNGATSGADLQLVARNDGATVVIPTEDEWYKAAYYDGAADVYFDLPMGHDFSWGSPPGNQLLDPDPGNSANYLTPWIGDPTHGAPYYRSEVGAFENSASPYGTYDQGGNVWEWNESIFEEVRRGMRGGSYGFSHGLVLHAFSRLMTEPDAENNLLGFRVAQVPEPATLALMAIGGLAMLRRRRH